MNRSTYYALCHEARFAKWAERERKRKRRALKQAHRDWLFNAGPLHQAIAVCKGESRKALEWAIRMDAIFG